MEKEKLVEIAKEHPKLTLDQLRSIGSADYKWEENNEIFLRRYDNNERVVDMLAEGKYGKNESTLFRKLQKQEIKLTRLAHKLGLYQ